MRKKIKTITREELARLSYVNSSKIPSPVDDNGTKKRWVGIGWVDEGKADGTEKAKVVGK